MVTPGCTCKDVASGSNYSQARWFDAWPGATTAWPSATVIVGDTDEETTKQPDALDEPVARPSAVCTCSVCLGVGYVRFVGYKWSFLVPPMIHLCCHHAGYICPRVPRGVPKGPT